MFCLELFRCLHVHNVRYLLAGGLAMNLHGVPRMTMDVDLVLALDDANIEAFLDCARELGLKPQAPVPLESIKDPVQRRSWIEEEHPIAFALAGAPGTPTVDVLRKHPLDLDEALATSLVQSIGDVTIRLASIDDMIVLKQNTGRRQDQDDIEHLQRIKAQQ